MTIQKYPCQCADMKWMVDNNKVFINDDGLWLLSWLELDKVPNGTINIEHFGVKFEYCLFCGKKI